MQKIQTKTLSKLTHHAAALVAFANSNQEFAILLYTHAHSLKTNEENEVATTPSAWLIPKSYDVAERRLLWLMQEITLASPKKTKEAQSIFSSWAKEHKEPQAIVLGIVGVAVIGPTLGLIKKKKKGRSQMRVLLNKKETSKGPKHVLELTLQACNSLLGNELANVGGQAYRLDPELADWLFAEHDTITKTTTDRELKETLTILKNESLLHFVIKADDVIQAIAIAPSVSDNL